MDSQQYINYLKEKIILDYEPIYIYKDNVIDINEYYKIISNQYVNILSDKYDISDLPDIKYKNKITKEYISSEEYLNKCKIDTEYIIQYYIDKIKSMQKINFSINNKLIFEYDPIFIYKNNVINYDEYLKLISHDYINKIYDINIKFQHKLTKEYITSDEYLSKYNMNYDI